MKNVIIKTIAPAALVAGLAWLGSHQGESARAFVAHGDSWNPGTNATVTYDVNANFPDAPAGTAAQQIAAIQRAASEWKCAGQTPFEFVYGTTTTQSLVAPTDGQNAVFYKHADGLGALATATWSAFANGDMFGFDIVFYDRMGTSMDFVWAVSPDLSQFDIESVAAHEFGHALGLGHSAVAGATMYATVSPGATANRTLHADDVSGVQSLYGVQATGSPLVTSITPGHGWIGGGDRVRLTGSELAGGDPMAVTFGGIPATDVTVIDSHTVECNLPMGTSSNLVDVSVTHAQGSHDVIEGFFNASMRVVTPLQVGSTGEIEVLYPADGNLPYIAAPTFAFDVGIRCFEYGDPGDTRTIPVNQDMLFAEQQMGNLESVFVGFNGTLDGSGYALLSVVLPDEPYLAGYVLCFSSISIDVAFPSDTRNIGNAAAGSILP